MIVQGNFARHACLPVETKDVDEAKLTRRCMQAKLIMIFLDFSKNKLQFCIDFKSRALENFWC